MNKDKQFIQIQLSLFFKDNFTEQVENISLKIKEIFGADLTAQILGIPDNAPSEIPRMVVNSVTLNINLAKNRLDIFSPDNDFVNNNLDKIFELVKFTKAKVNRIGYVLTFFKEGAFEELYQIFDKSKLPKDFSPKEINLRFNEEKEFSIGKVNNSQIYEVGSINKDNNQVPGVLITRDINTSIENKEIYSELKISNFITEAKSIAEMTVI